MLPFPRNLVDIDNIALAFAIAQQNAKPRPYLSRGEIRRQSLESKIFLVFPPNLLTRQALAAPPEFHLSVSGKLLLGIVSVID